MARCNWREFRAIAYPLEAAKQEAHRHFIYRAHRSVGLKLAFFFYHLRFTGNLLSVLRVVMSVAGVVLMLSLPLGEVIWPLVGAALIYGQVVLDFSDGALGRLTPGSPSVLGFQFDILGCDVARIAMVALLGSYTGSMVVIVVAASALYVLATFRPAILDIAPQSASFSIMRWTTRWLTSDQFLVVLLPFVLIGVRLISGQLLREFAWALVSAYAILAMAWLLGMVPVRSTNETAKS